MPEVARSYGQQGVTSAATLSTVLFAVVIVAALYLGREVLVPIALAVLLSFVLAPLIRLAQRWRFPRTLSVIIVVLIAFTGILGLGAVMVQQVNQLAGDLPGYQSTLREKIQNVRGIARGSGTLERAAEVLQDLGKEIDKPKATESARPPLANDRSPVRPIPVEVRQPDPGALQTIVALIAPLIHPLAMTGIVFLFVIFILIQREDLRNRLVRLAGVQDLQRTTAAIDDAGQRLSRLFLAQLALNAAFGAVIGTGLWLIGVPSAPLWGILAMILRFVPYIGALMSAVFPLLLAAAVGPDWSMLMWTALLFVVVEPVTGHVIEPLLFGRSTGLSPVAVIVSATFWTWLWGPIGLVLATPLTVCFAVLGRHVDRLKFLDVMFGDEPPLTPAELVYQRMLAGDATEAADQAQLYLKEKPVTEYYQEVLIESLKLAHADAVRGNLDDERLLRIRDTVSELVDDLEAHVETAEPLAEVGSEGKEGLSRLEANERTAEETVPVEFPPAWRTERAVLCIPGLGLLDEALALIVAQLTRRRGLGASAEKADALSMSRIFSLDAKDVALVCLCYVERATPAQIRYAIRRLRRKLPHAHILVLSLGDDGAGRQEEDQRPENTAFLSNSLPATLDEIAAIAGRSPAPGIAPSLAHPLVPALEESAARA